MKKSRILIKIIILIFVLLFLINCESLKTTVEFTTDKESLILIEETEVLLMKYIFTKDNIYLKKAKTNIKELEKMAKNNKYFEAKVIGFKGETALLEKKFNAVKIYIEEIKRKNKNEEKLYLLKAQLEGKIFNKNLILNDGINKADTNTYIKLNLANNYFKQRFFKQALDLFDEIFSKLPEIIISYYKKPRDISFKFAASPPKNNKTVENIMKNELKYKNVIELLLFETNFFKTIIKEKTSSINNLFKIILSKQFIYNTPQSLKNINDIITRKDIAFFLLNIIAELEGNSKIKEKYKVKDGEEHLTDIQRSPIKDINQIDYFYNSVLVLVEREIMELPDGENFFPDKPMNGIRFYEIIKHLLELY